MSDKEILTMRAMAWQRAKGELHAYLETFWDDSSGFEKADKKIKDFIKDFQDNCR